MSGPCVTRPDLCSICAAAEQATFADTARGLPGADRYPLAADDLPGPVARDTARVLARAGLTRCRCDRHDLLYQLGGLGLMAIPAKSGTGRSATAVPWTTCDLLPDWDRRATYNHTRQLANAVPGSILHASGSLNRQRGIAGACLVTSHRGQQTEAGQ